jgi:hypothetical protein
MVSIAVLVALVGWGGQASAAPRKGKRGAASSKSSRSAPSAEPASMKIPDGTADLRSAGSPAASGAQATSGAPPTRGPARIDFDDRLIQGQTNKSGAVYLYDRKELQTKSMVKRRESFRQEILSTVYDTR